MPSSTSDLLAVAQSINSDYLAHYPYRAARHLEAIPAEESALLLKEQPLQVVVNLWKYLPFGTAEDILSHLPGEFAAQLIKGMDSHLAVATLARLDSSEFQSIMTLLSTTDSDLAKEYQELLVYPEETAARMMTTKVETFYADTTVEQVMRKLRQRTTRAEDVFYIIDKEQHLLAEISLTELVICEGDKPIMAVSRPVKTVFSALDSKDMVIERFEGHRTGAIPVLDAHGLLIGVIRFFDIYQSTKEDLATDMQTMVGASKEERALSSSLFAVKKRLPWLQINLLTAFAAAAVVGAFEGLISEITALAILLPVAAGQSGNAGAQALAVTMRGLTLREITTRHWAKVMVKELVAGVLNGIAIAATCSVAVYFWSQSFGLALVIALAMVSSLAIACSAGAIVPIALKKFGMDPAQSSSIVLTTITDIAGFMSFLGIALLLSDMLPRG